MKIRGQFCERSLARKSSVHKKSFRWKKSGTTWLLIGCPKRYWKSSRHAGAEIGRCTVGTVAVKALVPARGRCKVGKRIVK
jgi:hypothetical protein